MCVFTKSILNLQNSMLIRLPTLSSFPFPHQCQQRDLRFILVDKAEGEIATKVNNWLLDGKLDGIELYGNVFKWYTETSGLGLKEQAAKLMRPVQAAKEENIAESIELW